VVKDAKRADTGPYTVTLKNPSGSADATVKVTVIGTSLLDFLTYLFNMHNTDTKPLTACIHGVYLCNVKQNGTVPNEIRCSGLLLWICNTNKHLIGVHVFVNKKCFIFV